MNSRRMGVLAIWLAVVFVVCGVLGIGTLAFSWFGYDSGSGNPFVGTPEYTENYDLPFSDDMALVIDVSSIDVTVVADGLLKDRVVAQFEGYRPRNAAGKWLEAVENGSSVTFKQINSGGMVNFSFVFIPNKLTVHVPIQMRGARIDASSGGIEVSGVTVSEDFEAEASSGDVRLNFVTAANIDAKTTSGSLDLDNARATGNITVKASSGDISCLQSYAQNIGAAASSGRVSLAQCEAAGSIEAQTSSGTIAIGNTAAKSVTARASSGDVRMDVSAPVVHAETSSGDISISNTAVADAELRASSGGVRYTAPTLEDAALDLSSSSGGIRVGGARSEKYYSRDGGSGLIKVNTTSGDITIN